MNKTIIIPTSLMIAFLLVSTAQAETSPSYSLSTTTGILGSGFDLKARLSVNSQTKHTYTTEHHLIDTDFDVAENFSLIETKSIELTPYLGIGWKDGVEKDNEWHFSLDAGVLFGSSETLNAMPIAIKNSDDFQPLPVISLETSYRF